MRADYAPLLLTMTAPPPLVGPFAGAVAHVHQVTASYDAGLFQCHDVPGLPPTNNALEQCCGSVRYHERRATGRKGAVPGRVVASVATRERPFAAEERHLRDITAWRDLRGRLAYRQAARRAQRRFRKDPEIYRRALEDRLSPPSLPP